MTPLDNVQSNVASRLYNTAVSEFQNGNVDRALEAVVLACVEPGAPATYHRTRAEILRRCGRSEEALAVAQLASELSERDPEIWETLGVIRLERGEFDEASQCFDIALSIKPSFECLNNLAVALQHSGHLEAAEANYLEALELLPESSKTELNLAAVQGKLGRFQDALKTVGRVLARGQTSVRAYLLASALEAELGRHAAALKHVEQAESIDPGKVEIWVRKTETLLQLGRDADALSECERVLAERPASPRMLHVRALTLQRLNRTGDALEAFRHAESVDGALPIVTADRAWLLAEMGCKDEARATLEQALSRQPDLSIAWYHRTYLCPRAATPADRAFMEGLVEDPNTPKQDRMLLSFAVGKSYLDIDDGAKAFAYLEEANRFKRAHLRYDPEVEVRRLRGIANAFSAESLARLSGCGDTSSRPIFVFGMPRSGTTLVEHILSSHALVYGAGETAHLRGVADRAGIQTRIRDASAEELACLGRRYLDLAAVGVSDGLRLVDKNPSNFELSGLISLILPNARMIHCRRNPLDTCLSCYSLLFATGHEYAYDLGELGGFYRLYEDLMSYWRAVLRPGSLLEVDYEDIVNDTDSQVRRILDFCDLPWDANCLRFHETSRRVTSASLHQVRLPIYKTSVGRAKLFRAWLGRLETALGKEDTEFPKSTGGLADTLFTNAPGRLR